jgi:hypothetical protein
MMRAVQIRALGGAMARVSADATALAHRNRRFMVNVAAMYQRREESEVYHPGWPPSPRSSNAEIRPHT